MKFFGTAQKFENSGFSKILAQKIEIFAKKVNFSLGCLTDIDMIGCWYDTPRCCRHVAAKFLSIGQVHVTW